MKLKISVLEKKGDASHEYVMFRVVGDCDLGDYVIADETFSPKGAPSNKVRHTYWFPKKPVKEGDLVVLRTGRGKDTEVPEGKIKKHRFYWNLDSPVWNDAESDSVTLLKVSDRRSAR